MDSNNEKFWQNPVTSEKMKLKNIGEKFKDFKMPVYILFINGK